MGRDDGGEREIRVQLQERRLKERIDPDKQGPVLRSQLKCDQAGRCDW